MRWSTTRHVAFVDPVCPAPYSAESLSSGALGGTEASIVRIAEALDAQVYQRNRDRSVDRYHPLELLHDPHVLIVLRDPKFAAELVTRFPGVPIFVWMHDLVEPGRDRAKRLRHYSAALAEAGAAVIAVSDFHRRQIECALAFDDASTPSVPNLEVLRIYNPLAEDLARHRRPDVDPDQLIYFSNATKGLDFAIFTFRALKARWPALRLLVANPGYASFPARQVSGVHDLGALPQEEVLARVATSLCTFCPNLEYPETFGLVLAESNAVGTPVLAHDYGAAAEILDDRRQIIDRPRLSDLGFRAAQRAGFGHAGAARLVRGAGGFRPFVERLEAWRNGGRPDVGMRPQFAIAEVASHWKRLIAAATT